MNNLDDLRSTLEQHAHDVRPLDATTHQAQVKGRIMEIRRRRNAVRGGVALAAVVAVAAGVLIPSLSRDGGQDLAADRTVLGMEAPAVVEAPDHTYHFVESNEDPDESEVSVYVEQSERPRILVWATAGDDQQVSVDVPHHLEWQSVRPDFADRVTIPSSFHGFISVTNTSGQTGVGAAVYEADPAELPDVVEAFHGQYFRKTGPETRRLGVGVGERGQTELTVPYADAGGHISVVLSCEGVPAGMAVHTDVIGAGGTSADTEVCGGDSEDGELRFTLTRDLGLAPSTRSDRDSEELGPDGEARVWISSSHTNRTAVDPADHPDARLAAAVYGPREEPEPLGDFAIAPTTWADGHLWELVSTANDVGGTPQDVSDLSASAPALAQVFTVLDRKGTVQVTTRVDGKRVGNSSNIGLLKDSGSLSRTLVPLGSRTFEEKAEPRDKRDVKVTQHVALYRLADDLTSPAG